MPLIEGQILEDKYEVVRLLARGGIGEVYLGVNVRLGKRVAIKVLSCALANEPVIARRFELEARVATRIRSAHVADTYDLGTLPTGESFIVMELLEGETMADRLARDGRIDERSLATLASQILDALEAAHHAGIVHRDLKPENVFITKQDNGDFAKLLDFGVSKLMDPAEGQGRRLTVTGAVLGTPLYMSPEQARGHDVDARTDLYALGVMLYEAALGEAPFTARNVNELLFRVALDNPTPLELRLPSVSPELAAIVRTAMAKSPRDRYASATAMREAVLGWQAALGPNVRSSAPSFRDAAPIRDAAPAHVSMPTPRPWALSRIEDNETLDLECLPRRRSKAPLFAAAILAGLVALGATHPQQVRAMSAEVVQRAHDLRAEPPAGSARAATSMPFITIEFPPPKASAAPEMAAIPVAAVPAAAPTQAAPTQAVPTQAPRPSAVGAASAKPGAANRPKLPLRAQPPADDRGPTPSDHDAPPAREETTL